MAAGGRGCRRSQGRGRGLRVLRGPGKRSSSLCIHGGRGCWSDGCQRELAQWQRQGWPWDLQAAQPTAWPAARAGTGELFRPQQGSEDAAVQDVRSANNMNDATQPQHFVLRSGTPASSRAFLQSGFAVELRASQNAGPASAVNNQLAQDIKAA